MVALHLRVKTAPVAPRASENLPASLSEEPLKLRATAFAVRPRFENWIRPHWLRQVSRSAATLFFSTFMNDQPTTTAVPDREEVHGPPRSGSPEGAPPPRSPKSPWYKRPLLVGLLMLVVIIIAVGGTLFWLHARRFESTDDAFVDIAPEQVSAQVAGRITRIFVDDNQEVTTGSPLLVLDPADYQTKLQQTLAAVAQAQAQQAQAEAQKTVFAAQAEQARAALGVAEANADNARAQRQRLESLRQENLGAVSQEQWDNAVAADKTTAAQREAAARAVAAAEAQSKYADSSIEAAQAGVKSAEAQVEQARLNLSYTRVAAQIDGRVAHKLIAVGNNIQPGQALMALVPRDVHITANFKETQLAHMRRGQSVAVHVDAYPDLQLTGHVDSVQPGTGQSFSALPAENATGNWVKVVQRVPVKIVLDSLPDDPEKRLGPGMSVEAKITVNP